ncbi:MAG: hypothetical protein U0572_05295 [Phycisphaerales bacterium]
MPIGGAQFRLYGSPVSPSFTPGRLPHDPSASPAELQRTMRHKPAPRISAVNQIQNAGLDAIATMALARKKERRYRSAASDLAIVLGAWGNCA